MRRLPLFLLASVTLSAVFALAYNHAAGQNDSNPSESTPPPAEPATKTPLSLETPLPPSDGATLPLGAPEPLLPPVPPTPDSTPLIPETPTLPAPGAPETPAGADGLGPQTSIPKFGPAEVIPGTMGTGPAISIPLASGPELKLPPRNKIDQTQAMADAKSVGCVQCHVTTDAHTMHESPHVILGCVDCHGGNPKRGLTRDEAHVSARFPEFWVDGANPRNSTTLLNHERPEFIRAVRKHDGDPVAVRAMGQRRNPIGLAEVAAQAMQIGTIGLLRGGSGVRRNICDVQLRKRPRGIGEQPWPFGRRRGGQKLGRGRQLTVSMADHGIELIGPVNQETRCDDQMNGHDRGDHQRRDLPADSLQIEDAR